MAEATLARRERVGRHIREARKEAGLSHDALAAKVGSSRQHLIKLEKGMHLPSSALLGRIAEATGKSMRFFERDLGEAVETGAGVRPGALGLPAAAEARR